MRFLPICFIVGLAACGCGKAQTDFSLVDTHIKQFQAWSQTLSQHGGEFADQLFDVIEGKVPNGERARKIQVDIRTLCSDEIAKLSGSVKDDFPEYKSWRETAIDYLRWQSEGLMDSLAIAIDVVEDTSLTQANRIEKVKAFFQETDKEELAWKNRLENATKDVYRAMNGEDT